MGKNWAKTGAKIALLTAGLVVIGSGAANAETVDAGKVTGALAPVTDAVGQITAQSPALPAAPAVPAAPMAKKHLDEPAPVLPGGPVQSSAINTAPALTALSAARDNVAQHAPGAKAATDGLDKAAAAVKDASASAPQPLAKKRGPIPGVSDKQVSIPPNDPAEVGTPLDKAGDPGAIIGGAVEGVTGKLGQPGLASQ